MTEENQSKSGSGSKSKSKRICGTCAWFKLSEWIKLGEHPSATGICRLEPKAYNKNVDEYCRHHAFTTGWLETLPQEPELKPVHLDFKPQTPDDKELYTLIRKTWLQYCSYIADWQLAHEGERDENS